MKSTPNVPSVMKPGVGQYCIELDSDVNVARSVPVATLDNGAGWWTEIYVTRQDSRCGTNYQNTVLVVTGNNGDRADEPFNIVIP